MAAVVAVPKLQASRKGKKAWRKNVDISEVTTGLDQVRAEIIQGGIIAEKADADLFTVDTTGSTNIRQKHFREVKPLKVDEILNARSSVPALINPKKRAGPSGIELGDGILPIKKHRKNGVSHKDLERLRRIAYGGEAAKDGVKTAKAVEGKDLYDPWGDVVPDAEGTVAKMDQLTFVEKPKKLSAPPTIKHAPIGITREDEETVPAVRLPDPGISYNPDFQRWDELLSREGEKEIELEKKRLEYQEYESKILALADIEDEDEEEEEDDEDDEDEEGEEEGEDKIIKKMPQRKTPSQRNKVKRRKEAERQARHQNKTEVQKRQLESLKELRKTLDVALKERAVAKRTALTPAKRQVRRRKFDKSILPQAPLELQLPEELADSLRRLKPEGNLLRDRYRNLRERGVIETRANTQQKKAKKKLTEKWSYKDWKP
ncbi:hypothetical protein TWF225_008908 [Orbilia oligospora]|nr:hypothetical protein TWF225_008908 [Orbilia oligospora]KAF3233348.1 hypothetical protein TWF217_004953 [Orbilia oligospora]KAF3243147.1 hypothetical protein TWF128_010356 [Orbilia oligospora]KAF3294802.1 hypothetical protein TWF132_002734 [Orbilia oligospora]